MSNRIAVNEIYGPVEQGEGKSAGLDVMFLRLSGCNLACIYCDTPYTWNWFGTKFAHPQKFSPKSEVHMMSVPEIKTQLYLKSEGVRGLVISGGEPMLQQERLAPLLQSLREDNWWIEVETNGTIEPSHEFIDLVNQFNCSPKTTNSGPDNPEKDRINLVALQKIANCIGKATFKFVIQSDEDLNEVKTMIEVAHATPNQVWLMPEGKSKEEQEMRQGQVKEIARHNGYNFSPRLHILEFGDKRAV